MNDSTEPRAAESEPSDEQLMAVLYSLNYNESARLHRTVWKDSIDIDVPSGWYRSLVRELATLSRAGSAEPTVAEVAEELKNRAFVRAALAGSTESEPLFTPGTPSGRKALATRLRSICREVRIRPYPIADVIPTLQKAADALDERGAESEPLRVALADMIHLVETMDHQKQGLLPAGTHRLNRARATLEASKGSEPT